MKKYKELKDGSKFFLFPNSDTVWVRKNEKVMFVEKSPLVEYPVLGDDLLVYAKA